ncbi:MAG TPA: hypothetical protein DCZ95_03125 [Verrucomicrobia bacterium]|nr:MAG: hypothetical protein A2X46_02290 [Lentisphaerae bacterium GWF2_57_35]HBA83065.1 hypothetical protein [Verrucomicrobiota bacterium]
MSVILMLIGVLMIMLVSNVLTIISNPENIKITSIPVSANLSEKQGEEEGKVSPFPFGNKNKEPSYIDVHRDRMILYDPDPVLKDQVVALRDLEQEGNSFEKLLTRVETNKANDYIILLARPRSAIVVRRLKKVIRDRGVDVGVELFEADRDVNYDKAIKASGKAQDGEKRTE